MNPENSPILEEIVPGARNLYVLFSSIDEQFGMPRFEFYQSSKILHENRLFFRDPYQCWYQNGLPGLGRNVHQVASFIKSRINDLKPQRVCFAGYSMGGYAAIMFAVLTGVGEAIAFSPRTSVHPFYILKTRDPRHKRQIISIYRYSLLKKHVWDLKKLIEHNPYKPKISIFVSKHHAVDGLQAERMKTLPNVQVFAVDSNRHDLVRMFREEGLLPIILSGRYPQPPD